MTIDYEYDLHDGLYPSIRFHVELRKQREDFTGEWVVTMRLDSWSTHAHEGDELNHREIPTWVEQFYVALRADILDDAISSGLLDED